MKLFIKLYTWMDHTPCNVSAGKRFFAYVIDWFLGSLVTMLPICFLWMYWTKDMNQMPNANVLLIAGNIGYTQAYLAGLLSVVFGLFYYVYVPWKLFPGQTCGKRAMGFRIKRIDEKRLDLKTLIIRQVIGIVIIEGSLYNLSGVLHSILSLATNVNFVNLLMYVGLAISVLSGFLSLRCESHRMLHDYIGKTMVELYEDETVKNQSI